MLRNLSSLLALARILSSALAGNLSELAHHKSRGSLRVFVTESCGNLGQEGNCGLVHGPKGKNGLPPDLGPRILEFFRQMRERRPSRQVRFRATRLHAQ